MKGRGMLTFFGGSRWNLLHVGRTKINMKCVGNNFKFMQNMSSEILART